MLSSKLGAAKLIQKAATTTLINKDLAKYISQDLQGDVQKFLALSSNKPSLLSSESTLDSILKTLKEIAIDMLSRSKPTVQHKTLAPEIGSPAAKRGAAKIEPPLNPPNSNSSTSVIKGLTQPPSSSAIKPSKVNTENLQPTTSAVGDELGSGNTSLPSSVALASSISSSSKHQLVYSPTSNKTDPDTAESIPVDALNNDADNNSVTSKSSKKMRLNSASSTPVTSWQRSATLIHSKIVDHRAGNTFSKSFVNKEPNYEEIVRFPIALDGVRQRIRSKVSDF